jgi:hypothetical protein
MFRAFFAHHQEPLNCMCSLIAIIYYNYSMYLLIATNYKFLGFRYLGGALQIQ